MPRFPSRFGVDVASALLVAGRVVTFEARSGNKTNRRRLIRMAPAEVGRFKVASSAAQPASEEDGDQCVVATAADRSKTARRRLPCSLINSYRNVRRASSLPSRALEVTGTPTLICSVAISALYPRIFRSTIGSPACPAACHVQIPPAQTDTPPRAEVTFALGPCPHSAHYSLSP